MGALPYTNLGIDQIRRELVITSGSMNTIRTLGNNYGLVDANKMSSWRGWQMPTADITANMRQGGIWDGCNYWDIFSYIEGADPILGQDVDPNFGYVGAYWTPNGNSFTQNNQRCSTCGTELTFDAGELSQVIHGNATVNATFIMVPQYTGFCTQIYMQVVVEDALGIIIDECKSPATHDYTSVIANFVCEPGVSYNVRFIVGYGAC